MAHKSLNLNISGSVQTILILALLWLASALLFSNLGALDFWGDEVSSIEMSSGSLASTLTHVAEDNKHPPFYFILLNVWREWAGSSEYAVRLLSTIPALLAIVIVQKLGTILGNKTIGLISALIVVISPFMILFSRMARYYALTTLLAMLSLYLFLRILRGATDVSGLVILLLLLY